MESFEYDGLWWHPDNCKSKWPGTLSFDHETGVSLKLLFETTDRRDFVFEARQRLPVVLGACHGVNFTVLDCLVARCPTAGSALAIVEMRAVTVLQGHHFFEVDQIQIGRFSVEYTYLSDWADWRLFQSKKDRDANTSLLSATLEPRKVECKEYTVSFCPHVNLGRTGRDELIRFRVSFHVAAKLRAITLQECLDIVHFQLRDFATLATGTANYPVQIDAYCHGSEEQAISIHVQYPGYKHSSKRRYQEEMLFSMKDVDEHLDACISNWVDNYRKLASAYVQYFYPCHYLGSPDVAIQFILIAQALESYHRDGQIASDICDRRPELAKRIGEILESLKTEQGRILDDLVSDNKFAKKIKNTRNLLTHDPFDDERKHVLYSAHDRWLYITKMKLLLEICFLDEMGLPPEKTSELIRRNRQFLRVTQVVDGI